MWSAKKLALLGIPIVIVLLFVPFVPAAEEDPAAPTSSLFELAQSSLSSRQFETLKTAPAIEDAVPISPFIETDCFEGRCAANVYSKEAFVAVDGVWKDNTEAVSLTVSPDFDIIVTSDFGEDITFESSFKKGAVETKYEDFGKKQEVNLRSVEQDLKSNHKFGFEYQKTDDFDGFVWTTEDPVTIDNRSKIIWNGHTKVDFFDLVGSMYTVNIYQDKGVTKVEVGNFTADKSFLDPTVVIGNETGGQQASNDTFVKQDNPTTAMGAPGNPERVKLVSQSRSAAVFHRIYQFADFSAISDNIDVTNATWVYIERTTEGSDEDTLGFHNVTQQSIVDAFNEYTVTWANQPCGTDAWEFNSSCNKTVGSDLKTVSTEDVLYSWNILEIVQSVEDTSKKFLMVMNGTPNEGGTNQFIRFESKEGASSASVSPHLYLEYDVVGPASPTFTEGSDHTYQGTVLEDDNSFSWEDGQGVSFDVEITDADGDIDNATLQFDGANHTASNVGDRYYVNFSSRAGGSYTDTKWYSTDATDQVSSLEIGTVTVSTKAMAGVLKYIDGVPRNKTVTASDSVTVSGNTTTTTTEGALPTFSVYLNDSLLDSGAGAASDTSTRSEGSYVVILNSSGNENFTAFDNSSLYLTVTPGALSFDLANQVFPPNGTWRADMNGSWLVNATQDLGSRFLMYFCINSTGSEVCTAMDPTYVRTINSTTNESHYWLNDLAAGSYQWRWSADDQVGSSEANYTGLYILSKAANNVSLSVSPSNTVAPTTTLNVTGTEDVPTGLTLTRDSVTVSNPYVAVLSEGTYTFDLSSTEVQNYTSASAQETVTVTTEGLGCTTPTTFSFRANVTSNGSLTALDFTDEVNKATVKGDLSDVFLNTSIQPNVSAARNQTGGMYYLVVNSTNVSWFQVEYSNYLGAQAWSNTTENQNVTQFSGAQVHPTYTFTMSEETTSVSQLPPNSNRTMTVYCDSGIRSFQVNDTKFTVASIEQPTDFRMKVDYGPDDSYNRYLIPTTDTESRTFYLVDAEVNLVAQMVLTLDDRTLTRDFSNGTILKIKKTLHDGLQTMTENRFDVDDKAAVFLIPNDIYSITVENGANSRTIGSLEVEVTDLTKTIIVTDQTDFDYNDGNFSWSVNMSNDGTIVFRWLDNSSLTDGVNFTVKNFTSGSTLYDDYSTANDVTFVYNTTAPNQTYQVSFHVASPTVGSESFGLTFLLGGPVAGIIPLLTGIINPAHLTVGVMLFLTFVGGLFGAKHSATGVIIVLVLAATFAAFGWITFGSGSLGSNLGIAGIIALLMVFAVIGAIVHKRRTDAE